jgi:hypothetical protein
MIRIIGRAAERNIKIHQKEKELIEENKRLKRKVMESICPFPRKCQNWDTCEKEYCNFDEGSNGHYFKGY